MNKSIKNILFIIGISLFVILFFFLLCSSTPNVPKGLVTRKVLIVNDLNAHKKVIEIYLKQGYMLESAVAQSVSTSIQTRNNGAAYNSTYRDIKGDILLIFMKYN